jgi:hypothetical protein
MSRESFIDAVAEFVVNDEVVKGMMLTSDQSRPVDRMANDWANIRGNIPGSGYRTKAQVIKAIKDLLQ